jgi:hypothetical protein
MEVEVRTLSFCNCKAAGVDDAMRFVSTPMR